MALAITGPLADLFTDSVTVETRTGQDGRGEPTYGAGAARSCRISGGGKLRLNPETGQEYVTKGKVLFAGASWVRRGDRLTLPSGFSPQKVIAEDVETVRDENGPHHDKVFF